MWPWLSQHSSAPTPRSLTRGLSASVKAVVMGSCCLLRQIVSHSARALPFGRCQAFIEQLPNTSQRVLEDLVASGTTVR